MAEQPSTKQPSQILTHAETPSGGEVVPMGGCIIHWDSVALKSVLAHMDAQAEKSKADGVKPLGGCIIHWW